jgi:hypothetical protein
MAPYWVVSNIVYCLSAISSRPKGVPTLRIIGSIYINHFEMPTHLSYVGHNPKKIPIPCKELKNQ